MHFWSKKKGNTKGLSTIVATLLIILLVLVAVGIIWLVIKNVILGGTEQISLGKLTLSLDIESISRDISENSMDIKIKRNSGEGDFFGLVFIAEEEDNTETIKIRNVSLNQFETKTFRNVNLSLYMNVSELKKVSVAPIFILKSGKEAIGNIADVYLFSAMLEVSEIVCNDTCSSLGYTCGTRTICGEITNCGTCSTGYVCSGASCVEQSTCNSTCSSLGYSCGIQPVCNVSTNCGTCPTGYDCNTFGQCIPICTDTCESLGYTCGTYSVCGVSTTCWGCSDGEICNKNTCTPCQGAGCIASCGTLSTAGQTYFLTSNVTSIKMCFNINAPNVVLDCQGRWITYSTGGEDGTYGILTTQFNTTIKNCNVLDGNWSPGANSFRFGIYLVTSDNSTLFNNFVNMSNSPGIYSTSEATFNNITKNRVVSNSSTGIYLFSYSDNNFLKDNIVKNNLGTGIIVYNSSGNTLVGNNGTSNLNTGILLSQSSYNKLTNNIGISNSIPGILLVESSNNVLTGNNGTSDLNTGISIVNSPYTTLINQVAKGIIGIGIEQSYNAVVINSTVEGKRMGNDNPGTRVSGTYLYLSSNVTLINHKSTAPGVYDSDSGLTILSSNNSIFRDSMFDGNGKTDVAYLSGTKSINNTFINCDYNTEIVTSGNELIRKWYYRAYVNDTSGNAIANAGVSATNNLGINQFTKLTSSSGWINTQELTDYINSGGVKTYYSNYVITANKSGYTVGTKNYNITIKKNNFNDFFTLS